MPLFLAKKEVFEWLSQGQKTIDVRKGTLKPGEIAFFQSGSHALRLKIVVLIRCCCGKCLLAVVFWFSALKLFVFRKNNRINVTLKYSAANVLHP